MAVNVSLNSIQFLAERKLYLKNNDFYLLEDFLKCLIIVRQEIVESSFLLPLESERKNRRVQLCKCKKKVAHNRNNVPIHI